VACFANGYLRAKAHSVLHSQEGEGGWPVRVIIDHAEGKLTIQELVDRANRGDYRGRRVIFGVSNDDPHQTLSFCSAAFANGAVSITIPSNKVNIPVVLMTAESLSRNPLFRSGNIPQVAWRQAEADVLEALRGVIKESGEDDAKPIELLDRVVPGFKASPMFLGEAERDSWNLLV
jgi:hypothetical protein